MKSFFKVICPALILAVVLTMNSIAFGVEFTAPEAIKIGIYFSDAAKGISNASSGFIVNADKGVQIGFYNDGAFENIFRESGSDKLSVKKDSSYYIGLGGIFNDYASAKQHEDAAREKGIESFTAWKEGWVVLAGPFAGLKESESFISGSLKEAFPEGEHTVLEPSKTRIAVYEAEGSKKILTVFDSGADAMVIRPEEQNNPYKLNLDGVPFRGEFEVKRLSASDMTVINVLPLQEYLYGVVPGEIESYSHIEALKAQAVAARTYTVNNMNKYKENGFNLCNTTWSQVYKGYSAETESTNRAVDETKGQIVLYNDKPAQVFYFSSSGGQTEDVKNVWGSDFPYLSSVEDKYESGKSWNYNWTKTLTAEEIKKRLISKGKDVGEVTGIDILKTSGAGRPVELVISGTKSQAVFKNAATRDIFGLPSQMYTIESSSGKDNSISIRSATSEVSAKPLGELNVMSASGEMVLDAGKGLSVAGRDGKTITVSSQSSDSYTFSGRGWGHAIGMSQEGAKGMANEGFTYDEILTHYFQGTEVK